MARPARDELRGALADAAAIMAVAGLLVAVHAVVSPGLREASTLRYADPDPLHAITAAYVHLTDAHLRGNVVGFIAAGGLAALLARLADQPRWFRFAFLWYLTVLPMAVGMTAATLVDAAVVGRGFSTVVAGFVGFVLVSPAVVLRRGFGFAPWVGWNAVGALTVVVGAEILWVVNDGRPPDVAALLAVGLALTLAPFVARAVDRSNWPGDRAARLDLARALVTTLVVLAAVSAFVVGLFPAEIVGNVSVTNILAHYLGLAYGAVIAGGGSRYWSVAEPRRLANRGS